ncbi:Hsp20/alpha crystallin family protein [Desulfogranum japonicum]|uniref:Hsp20/alpha crystallin family protein n=1 Tax=Desulfogranum japonicum TaxID=231447 RepID=UPI0003FF2B25|nr:Hsp20/alpha crystallin family protein [Desulfogranum japonicum]
MQNTEKPVVSGENTKGETYYSPMVDIYETPQAVTVVADIPGVTRDGLDISLEDDILTIHGKMTCEIPEGRVLLQEYEAGHFMRRFTIAETIDQSSISANLDKGVLKIVLPKSAPAKPRKIEVQMT